MLLRVGFAHPRLAEVAADRSEHCSTVWGPARSSGAGTYGTGRGGSGWDARKVSTRLGVRLGV